MTDSKITVVCLIKNTIGKYLMILPADYKNFGIYQDAWYPPGGHVHYGEQMEGALKRELKEELNLDIEPVKLISKWEQDVLGEIAYWWECKINGGKIKKGLEIKDYRWFAPEEIKKLKLWPAERKFFEKYLWE